MKEGPAEGDDFEIHASEKVCEGYLLLLWAQRVESFHDHFKLTAGVGLMGQVFGHRRYAEQYAVG